MNAPSSTDSRPAQPVLPPPAMPPTLFDLLPAEACENIVRHLSAAPLRADWPEALSGGDVASLFSLPGALGSAARAQFRSLASGLKPVRFADGARRGLHLGRATPLPAVAAVACAPGAAFSHVALLQAFGAADSALLACIAAHHAARGLRGLGACRLNLRVLLPALGGGLRVLHVPELACAADVALIAAACPGLREFCALYSPVDLTPVWRACGGTLERVRCSFRAETAGASLAGLRAHCGGLRRVHVDGRMDFGLHLGALGALCARLGAQLEAAVLPAAVADDAAVCKQIARACPGAQLEFRGGPLSPAGLALLGPRVRRAVVMLLGKHDLDEMRAGWVHCTRPEALQVYLNNFSGAPVAQSLLDLCAPGLVELQLCLVAVAGTDALFEGLAGRAANLDKFVFRGALPAPKPFAAFAHAATALQHVSFAFETDGAPDGDDSAPEDEAPKPNLEDYLAPLAEARALREVVVRTFPGISSAKRIEYVADACNRFRHRGVYVHVAGHDYIA